MKGRAAALAAALAAAAAATSGCGGGSSSGGSLHIGPTPSASQSTNPPATPPATPPVVADWPWPLPAYFAAPVVPADNPMTPAKVALGRHLFYDKRLSGNGTQACASCHQQAKAFSDGRALALGATGVIHPRSAMALVNVAWNASYTWANNVLPTLERQIINPIFGRSPVELGVDDDTVNLVLERLRTANNVDYPALFARAYPESPPAEALSWHHLTQAITSFERTLISVNSKYDQVRQGRASYTPQEARGWQVFQEAECIKCHREPNFTDQFVSVQTPPGPMALRYHNKGLYNLGNTAQGYYAPGNLGVTELTFKPQDMGKYRTPTLRNIAVTAPYTSDGSIATLEEAVEIFTSGGRNIPTGPLAGDGRLNPYKSRLIQDRALSADDKAALVAFLKTLTDTDFLTNPQLSDPFAKRP